MPNIIITGGPGSGKSTLLDALFKKGYHCVPEVSRQLIREQVLLKSNCLPWKDLASFAKISLEKMIFDYESADPKQITFFDRGIPDIVAYLKAGGLDIPEIFCESTNSHVYATIVFMAPPWKEIYINDEERWQTFEEACFLHETIHSVYFDLAYQIVQLPYGSVEERVSFVMRNVNEKDFRKGSVEHIKTFRLPSAKS